MQSPHRFFFILLSASLALTACAPRPSPSAATSEAGTSVPAAALPTETPPPAAEPGSSGGSFALGVRISVQPSPQQIEFINQHYQVVMTPFLSQAARQSIQGAQLILYRSIQGTWEGFEQFDWEYINAHENMFAHHAGERILTRWDSWLMAPGDMVAPEAEDARAHWVNYYALTASEQVYQYGYDGLFIDSASHWLNPSAVYGKMPDDYDAEAWYQARVAALAYIKSRLPDKTVVFNGLHNGHGAEDSLANTDGGMWETFAFQPRSGAYQGETRWRAALDLTARHPDKAIVLVVKEQPGLQEDIQKRTFAAASYLLVSRPNVYFSMSDLEHADSGSILYYPEYDLDVGAPLGAYSRNAEGVYLRQFEKGLVLVNPSETESLTCRLEGEYLRAVPEGGGSVARDGAWEGSLRYEPLSGEVEIPPLGAFILLRP